MILRMSHDITLENGSISRLDSKRSDVGDDFGTGLENDKEDANGT